MVGTEGNDNLQPVYMSDFFVNGGEIHGLAGNDDISVSEMDGYPPTRSFAVYGGEGDDVISLAVGPDIVDGEPGNDILDGGWSTLESEGDHYIYSEDHDLINMIMYPNADHYIVMPIGSSASDLKVKVDQDYSDYALDLGNWLYKISVDDFQNSITIELGQNANHREDMESIDLIFPDGSIVDLAAYGLELHGDAGSNYLKAFSANDTLYGNDGDDEIYGGPGDDIISGGSGNDEIFTGFNDEGAEYDLAYGNDGDDEIQGSLEATLFGGAGNDLLRKGAEQWGGDGANRLHDGQVMHGGGGNDEIKAIGYYFEHYTMYGDAGDDVIEGHDGDDIIYGSLDIDTMSGGAGADTFVYTSLAEAGDKILDFDPTSGDKIDLTGILGGSEGFQRDQAFTDGYLRVTQAGNYANVYVDVDGDAGSEASDVFLVELLDKLVSEITLSASIFPESVASVNTALVAADDVFSGDQDLDISGNLLIDNGNGADSDADGDSLSVTAETITTANGSVQILADGSFTYTPNAGYVGADSFSYTLLDGNGGSDTGLVSLTLNAASSGDIVGTAGNDSLTGTTGDDVIRGLSGNDVLDGDLGDDVLYGDAGADTLKGHEGSIAISLRLGYAMLMTFISSTLIRLHTQWA